MINLDSAFNIYKAKGGAYDLDTFKYMITRKGCKTVYTQVKRRKISVENIEQNFLFLIVFGDRYDFITAKNVEEDIEMTTNVEVALKMYNKNFKGE